MKNVGMLVVCVAAILATQAVQGPGIDSPSRVEAMSLVGSDLPTPIGGCESTKVTEIDCNPIWAHFGCTGGTMMAPNVIQNGTHQAHPTKIWQGSCVGGINCPDGDTAQLTTDGC